MIKQSLLTFAQIPFIIRLLSAIFMILFLINTNVIKQSVTISLVIVTLFILVPLLISSTNQLKEVSGRVFQINNVSQFISNSNDEYWDLVITKQSIEVNKQ
ncbi:MAG: hypothetical protein OEY49_15375 [Candidatus Heimdallarchaeota archaeon]|nr:hypothetical protein [Candidatus Heimdallarchaeota archaeon]